MNRYVITIATLILFAKAAHAAAWLVVPHFNALNEFEYCGAGVEQGEDYFFLTLHAREGQEYILFHILSPRLDNNPKLKFGYIASDNSLHDLTLVSTKKASAISFLGDKDFPQNLRQQSITFVVSGEYISFISPPSETFHNLFACGKKYAK